jgi:Kef-type K+ transport system membrane component KefB
MNTRGLVELIVLNLRLQAKILDVEIFTIVSLPIALRVCVLCVVWVWGGGGDSIIPFSQNLKHLIISPQQQQMVMMALITTIMTSPIVEYIYPPDMRASASIDALRVSGIHGK